MRLRVVHRSQLGPNHRTCGVWSTDPDDQREWAEQHARSGRAIHGCWYPLSRQDQHKQWFVIDTWGRDGR